MKTSRLSIAVIALSGLFLQSTAEAQFRGGRGNSGFQFRGNGNSGGNQFRARPPVGNFQQNNFGLNSTPRFNLAPSQAGVNSGSISTNGNRFRSFAPNQPGANAPRFNIAPNQAGTNAPRFNIAPNQAGNNSPGIGVGTRQNIVSAPFQGGNNSPSVNPSRGGFASFNQGFGGNGGFGGQQFASATPTSTSFAPQQSSFTPSAFSQSSQASSGASFGSQSFGSQSFDSSSFASQQSVSQSQTAFSPVRPPVLQNQFSNAPIRILLPKNYTLGVNYTLNEFTYAMTPGQNQGFSEDRDWVVRFDRGLSQGTQEYSLVSGTYCFACNSSTGWELYRISDADAVALGR